MQINNKRFRQICGGAAFIWIAGLSALSCGPVKSSEGSGGGSAKIKGPFTLQSAMQSADTTAIRQFLAGSWTLDRICRSTFAGLKCDTSIRQRWQLDSLGAISWTTGGDNAGTDQYHFVSRDGARAGSARGKAVWVMFLNGARRGYLIRTLTQDSLSLSEYPLIMDNTTTYYLNRQH